MAEIYFISGIDTDAGKSYSTGWLACKFMEEGKSVITQKFIQTGNVDRSEDIELHRAIMGIAFTEEDANFVTAPEIFSYPCSPQLAARIDGRDISLNKIDACTKFLVERYDVVLIEGAGGLLVPISDDYFTIDYVAERRLPMVLVIHGNLGSINHIILSLEAIRNRGIVLAMVLYNTYYDKDPIIAEDTYEFVKRYLSSHFPDTPIFKVPKLNISIS